MNKEHRNIKGAKKQVNSTTVISGGEERPIVQMKQRPELLSRLFNIH